MTDSDDVLVIGGGVIGVCSAYYLAERGCRVVLIDQDEICSGASWGNAGFVCPSHAVPLAAPGVIGQAIRWMFDPASPFYIKPRLNRELFSWLLRFAAACTEVKMEQSMPVLRALGVASMELHEQLAAIDGLAFDMRREGLLMVYGRPEAYEAGAEEARLLQDHGVRAVILGARELQQRLGDLGCTGLGAVFFPDDAHLDPGEFVKGLARMAEGMGVEIRPSTEVLGWETSGHRVTGVRTTRGTLHPGQIVLATGAWSASLARDLGITLPIQAAKGYSVTFKRPANCLDVPMLLGETKVAVTPLADALRLGGTLELAGMDLSVNQRRVDAILQAAQRFLPGLSPSEITEIWRGLRPCTPDGLPMLGRCEGYDNLVVAAGHGTLGIALGPVTGKLVSQVLLDETPMMDLRLLRVDRFA